MAVGKEIRGKIKIVENTKKITKAMEMVAASQDAQGAGAHARGAARTATRSATSRPTCRRRTPSTSSPYMRKVERRAKAVGFIVVTTDKGLCGGLNTNVLRAVTNKMREVQDAGGKRAGGGHRQQGLRLPEPHRRQGGEPRRRSSATRRSSTS